MRACTFQRRLVEPHLVTTVAWVEDHRAHDSDGVFGREPFPHPDGTWVWLVCRCGAKHLTDKPGPEQER
jgi:hypothetical protein